MRCAAATPANAPPACAAMYAGTCRHSIPRRHASANVTAGLKCAPEIAPNVRIRATSVAPVAIVLASSAMATLPPDKRSPMMPDPTMAASNSAVPNPSDATRRANVMRSGAALRPTARARFHRTNESAHEFSVHLRSDGLHVDAFACEKLFRVLQTVDTGRLQFDLLESGSREFAPIFVLFERPRNAANPQENTSADLRKHLASRH